MVFFHKNWRPLRSVLFMPASNVKALQKAPDLDCDSVIFDLEDAVASGEQEQARQNLLTHVKRKDFNSKELVVRVSEIADHNFADDLKTALLCEPDAILLPKVETTKHIEALDTELKKANSSQQIWAMIESPMALIRLPELVSCSNSTNLSCLVVGPNDLARTTGVKMQPGRAAMSPWLMQIVAAARSYDLSVLDGVFNQFSDLDGLEIECKQGAAMGFDGKTLIHPKQIENANRHFSPDQNEIDRARKIVELFSMKENTGRGALQMDGEMIEPLHLSMAQKLLEAFGRT